MEKQYVDDGLPTDFPVFAPFLADIDTSGGRGQIYYRVTEMPSVLNRVAQVCLRLKHQNNHLHLHYGHFAGFLTVALDCSLFQFHPLYNSIFVIPSFHSFIHSFIWSPRKYSEGSQMPNSHPPMLWLLHGRTLQHMRSRRGRLGHQIR